MKAAARAVVGVFLLIMSVAVGCSHPIEYGPAIGATITAHP